ncbi:MAG TPA: MauE/DoxX family redox-associated membrane protein, partial [Bacteroidales bacterium]|nr:MauE/DoxX family redox-associated membrane protein [Bacteroidales bacterium]
MKIIRTISRIILGLVFIFSGVVKAIDPLGSAYKFHDYFQAFNLGFLYSLSLPLAILLCLAEFISGFSVISGIKYKSGLWGVLLLLSVFT